MEITKIFQAKSRDLYGEKNPTIAFLGDSVTQGCFEVYTNELNQIDTVFDRKHTYSQYLSDILAILYPRVQVNMVNAGISGDNAVSAYERMERDVLKYKPDLTIVGFGLNDCSNGLDGITMYIDALKNIFRELKANNSEVIFLTPNMMNTRVSCFMTEKTCIEIAEDTMKRQNEGILDQYVNAAIKTAESFDVKVCDVYGKWKLMEQNGIDTTSLLSNYINHPTREMNYLTAFMIIDCMMSN